MYELDIGVIINTIINVALTAVVGYIAWSYKDRDAKKDRRIEIVEKRVEEVDDKLDCAEKGFIGSLYQKSSTTWTSTR